MGNEVICLNPAHGPIRMHKESSGIKVKLPNNYCMTADLYKCPECGHEVLSDNSPAYEDRKPDYCDYDMSEGFY